MNFNKKKIFKSSVCFFKYYIYTNSFHFLIKDIVARSNQPFNLLKFVTIFKAD